MIKTDSNKSVTYLGEVTELYDEVTGYSKKTGQQWKKRTFVLGWADTQDFQHKIAIIAFGDVVRDLDDVREGDIVSASVNIESREWNGNWYTNLNLFKIEKKRTAQPRGRRPRPRVEDDLPPDNSNDIVNQLRGDDPLPF